MLETRMLELSDAHGAVAVAMKKAESNNWKISISCEKARTAAIFRDAPAPMQDRIANCPGTTVLPGAAPLNVEFRSLPAGR